MKEENDEGFLDDGDDADELTDEELEELDQKKERQSKRLPPIPVPSIRKQAKIEEQEERYPVPTPTRTPVREPTRARPQSIAKVEKWEFVYSPEIQGFKRGNELLNNSQAIEKILNMLEEIRASL